MAKVERVKVEVGQVWEDCDKRMHARKVEVESVSDNYAYCKSRGKAVRIRLDRMYPHSTGFKLVSGGA